MQGRITKNTGSRLAQHAQQDPFRTEKGGLLVRDVRQDEYRPAQAQQLVLPVQLVNMQVHTLKDIENEPALELPRTRLAWPPLRPAYVHMRHHFCLNRCPCAAWYIRVNLVLK